METTEFPVGSIRKARRPLPDYADRLVPPGTLLEVLGEVVKDGKTVWKLATLEHRRAVLLTRARLKNDTREEVCVGARS